MIRAATTDDIPAIVGMSRKFYVTTEYAALTPMSDETVASVTAMIIDTGICLVSEVDGVLNGIVALLIAPFLFNSAINTAHEVIWWADMDSRGAGVGKALLNAVEPACRERGVRAIQMMHLATSPPQVGLIYKRMGYKHSETCFTKGI